MLRTALASTAALTLTLAPIAAQAAPQEVSRTGAPVAESEELVGTTAWILAAIAAGLIIWGAIELFGNDDDDAPVSP